jgi:hypothetical protein
MNYLRQGIFKQEYHKVPSCRPNYAVSVLSRIRMWLSSECGLEIGFIDHLHVVNASNYNAIANFHTLQTTTAHAKPFHSAVSSTVFPWYRLLTVEILQLPPSLRCPLAHMHRLSLPFANSLTTLFCFSCPPNHTSARTTEKTLFTVVLQSFPWECVCCEAFT